MMLSKITNDVTQEQSPVIPSLGDQYRCQDSVLWQGFSDTEPHMPPSDKKIITSNTATMVQTSTRQSMVHGQ